MIVAYIHLPDLKVQNRIVEEKKQDSRKNCFKSRIIEKYQIGANRTLKNKTIKMYTIKKEKHRALENYNVRKVQQESSRQNKQ